LDVGFEIAFFLPKAEKTHESLEPFMSHLVELSRSRYQDTAGD
jgi:hypothetical protein